ncbi:MAG: hydroxyisourate hydrolase [Solirubrobacterales bacterium]
MPNTNRPTISTHVLDVTRGEPAAGLAVSLWRLEPGRHNPSPPPASRVTDVEGRIGDLVDGPLAAGVYRLTFDVADYFRQRGDPAPFFNRVTLDVEVADPQRRYHVPLLVTPFSCASYRGS